LKILHINNYGTKGGAETVFNITKQNLSNYVNYSGFVLTDPNDEKPDIEFTTWENKGSFKGALEYIFSYANIESFSVFLTIMK
jgi:mRNA deadenylase 3'-5' endonuclease subunit Ccr4